MTRHSLRWLAIAAVCAILVATAIATAAAIDHGRDDARMTRATMTAAATRALASALSAAEGSVADLRASFEASSQVTGEDFARLAAAPLARQAHLDHLAWTPGRGEAYVARRRGSAAGEVASGAASGTVHDAARDAGATRMTGPVVASGGERLVVFVAAVYAPGARIATVPERRAALRGFVHGGVLLAALAQAAAADLPDGARVEVSDRGAVVIGSGVDGGGTAGAIDVAGHRWTLTVTGLAGTSTTLPAAVAGAGVLLAGLVALLFVESTRRERGAREELAGLRVRHDVILASAGDGIIGVDADGRAAFVNPAAARMLGWTAEELTARALDDPALIALPPALAEGRPRSGEETVRRRDGSAFPVEYTITPIVRDGVAAGAVVTLRDVTARKEVEAQTLENLAVAEERAAVDPMTGLANHRTFHDRLRAEVERARRSGRDLSLVLMDLDHFKRVNDRHGHRTGDLVLQHAARVLQEQTRVGELVARVGGEEFAMILPDADGAEAFRAAERVRRAIAAATFPAVGAMTMSAGVCDLPPGADADTLYRLADHALYSAKHRGRDMVQRHRPGAGGTPADGVGDHLHHEHALRTIRQLAEIVDAREPTWARHSERVGELAGELAEALGWPADRAALLREAACLHDVGKICVPEAVLVAPGPLGADERRSVEEHPRLGADIVRGTLTDEQVSWIRGHHESWDGSGYPDGLRAEDCPEGARIIALADAWDAMTCEHPHAPVPLSHEDAITECRMKSGSQFWPAAVDALVRIRGGA